jgi:F0F1-type ATP synthase membrane subunit a
MVLCLRLFMNFAGEFLMGLVFILLQTWLLMKTVEECSLPFMDCSTLYLTEASFDGCKSQP